MNQTRHTPIARKLDRIQTQKWCVAECERRIATELIVQISFDTFYMAFVTIFVVLTMEYWTEVMYKVSDWCCSSGSGGCT